MTERQPVSSPLPRMTAFAQMHDHAMPLAGVSAREYYSSAQTIVDTVAGVADYYGMDRFRPSADVYNFEIEALGGRLVYGSNSMPTIDFNSPLISDPSDLLKLNTPDFLNDARLPYALECMRLAQLHPRGLRAGYFCGPFSMAVGLRGFPALVKDMRKRPGFARDLFDFIVDAITIPYLRVQKEYAGVLSSSGADAWACIPNLSVRDLEEWVLPVAARIRQRAAQFGVSASCGIADYIEERPEKFDAGLLHRAFDIQVAAAGRPAIMLGMGRWQDYPLEPVLAYAAAFRSRGERVSVRATINARLLRDGPVQSIVDLVKRYISVLAPDHNLDISMANIPADTPSGHVHAAVAAIHAYGRFPITADLDKVTVDLPVRESFRDWKRNRASGATGSGEWKARM